MTGNTNGDVFYWLAMSQSSGPGGYSGGFFSYHSNEGIFSPEEALAIDATIDDGKPATGLVVATTYNVNFTNGGVPYPMALDAAIDGCTASGAGYSTSRSETTLCRLLVKANIKK